MRIPLLPAGILVLPLLLSTAEAGPSFPAIPAAVWAQKEGPKGATILEDRIRFNGTTIDHQYRVRIFAEAGKEAAEVEDLPTLAFDIAGRTVYPDGREVRFNSRKDFAERVLDAQGTQRRRTHLVAPGVTADCVVEFQWSEPADGPRRGLPRRIGNGYYGIWNLANPYPTQVRIVEMTKSFPLAWSMILPDGMKPEINETLSYKKITFKDLGVLEVPPYGILPTLNSPKLLMYWMPDELLASANQGPAFFWQEVVNEIYRPEMENDIDKGSAYRALSKELTADLPASPSKAAMALLTRLDARIVNLSQASFAEQAALPKGFWESFHVRDLNAAAKTGKTNAFGMQLLFYHLLKDARIKPLLAKVVDRDLALFDWNLRNPWQYHHEIFGVEEPGSGTVWMDPTLRYAMPGLVHPDYTGVSALIVNTDTWKASSGTVGGLGAQINVRKYTYAMTLEEEGDAFELTSEFGGFPEYAERIRYMSLEPQAQSKELKERLEKGLKNLQITSAEVLNAHDPKNGLSWKVKGTLERESGRNRVVDPFPAMPWPLWVPSNLEESRKVPIILPYLSTQLAVTTFPVPKGYTMEPHQEFRRENRFGRVIWTATLDPAARTVKVILRTEVNTLSAPAMDWRSFRSFLAWIEDACRRQVTLSKEA